MVGESASLHFGRVDEALGPSEGRYFGDGHRRVSHYLRDVIAGSDASGHGWASLATVEYPTDWSENAEDTIVAQVSSVDAAVLAADLATRYLVEAFGLGEDQFRWAWARSMEMRAGSRPLTNLADLVVQLKVIESRLLKRSLCGQVTTFDCGWADQGSLRD